MTAGVCAPPDVGLACGVGWSVMWVTDTKGLSHSLVFVMAGKIVSSSTRGEWIPGLPPKSDSPPYPPGARGWLYRRSQAHRDL